MHKSILIAAVGLVLVAQTAFATNGHQLIGIGGYQKSMGGAVTAAPDGASTAVSNPAGMALIGTKADFNFDAFFPGRTADFTDLGGQENDGGSPMYLIPAVGWVGPVGDSDDLFFGGGMFLMSGMGVDFDTINAAPFNAVMGQLSGVTDPSQLDMTMWKANLYSQYQFWKLAPTLAKRFSEQLSVGISLNVDYQQMAFKQKFFNPSNPGQYMGVDLSRAVGALGFGVTVGAIYKVSDTVQLGFNYISEQSFADMEYRVSAGDIVSPPNGLGQSLVNDNGTYSMGMNFPQQLAFGVAFTPTENLKITADYKWINFSATHDVIDLTGNYALVDFSGTPVGQATSMPLNFGWSDVSVIAIGAEFKVNETVTLRAGYNHGDSPIGEEDVWNNMIFPAITTDHIGLGAEFALTDRWGLGLAYMKAFKEELVGSQDMTVLGQTLDSGAKIALEETSLVLSLSYNYGK